MTRLCRDASMRERRIPGRNPPCLRPDTGSSRVHARKVWWRGTISPPRDDFDPCCAKAIRCHPRRSRGCRPVLRGGPRHTPALSAPWNRTPSTHPRRSRTPCCSPGQPGKLHEVWQPVAVIISPPNLICRRWFCIRAHLIHPHRWQQGEKQPQQQHPACETLRNRESSGCGTRSPGFIKQRTEGGEHMARNLIFRAVLPEAVKTVLWRNCP